MKKQIRDRTEYSKRYYKKNRKRILLYLKVRQRNMTEEERIFNRKRSRKYRRMRIQLVGKKAFNKNIKNAVAKWRAKHPLRVRAHRKVYVALRNKTLKRKPCFCGKKKSEAHHKNYRRPLKVQWLCKLHHAEADRKLRNKKFSPPLVC